MQPGETRKFEVFVTPLQEGNINDALDADPFNPLDLDQIKDIIDQLFDGLNQLKQANVCHNDIKPANILYCTVGNRHRVKIADFGQCNKKGAPQVELLRFLQEIDSQGKKTCFRWDSLFCDCYVIIKIYFMLYVITGSICRQ